MKIYDMWMEYKKILPPGASEIQIKETKRAFYTAIRMFSTHMMSLDENMSDAEAEKITFGWMDELQDFHKDLMEGRA